MSDEKVRLLLTGLPIDVGTGAFTYDIGRRADGELVFRVIGRSARPRFRSLKDSSAVLTNIGKDVGSVSLEKKHAVQRILKNIVTLTDLIDKAPSIDKKTTKYSDLVKEIGAERIKAFRDLKALPEVTAGRIKDDFVKTAPKGIKPPTEGGKGEEGAVRPPSTKTTPKPVKTKAVTAPTPAGPIATAPAGVAVGAVPAGPPAGVAVGAVPAGPPAGVAVGAPPAGVAVGAPPARVAPAPIRQLAGILPQAPVVVPDRPRVVVPKTTQQILQSQAEFKGIIDDQPYAFFSKDDELFYVQTSQQNRVLWGVNEFGFPIKVPYALIDVEDLGKLPKVKVKTEWVLDKDGIPRKIHLKQRPKKKLFTTRELSTGEGFVGKKTTPAKEEFPNTFFKEGTLDIAPHEAPEKKEPPRKTKTFDEKYDNKKHKFKVSRAQRRKC